MSRRRRKADVSRERTAQALTPACFHVLLALADGPLHGYAIMRSANAAAGGTKMGPGTIYGTLQRLLDDRLVDELDRADDERRRTFELTPGGRDALAAESRRLVRLAELVRAHRLVPESES